MTGVPAVSVVVPSRDRPDRLAGCLAALESQTAPDYEVVVVDDGSLDADAVAAVVAAAPHARLVRGQGRGPATARNLGASAARGDVLCFTDDDCRPGPGWVEALAGRLGAGRPAPDCGNGDPSGPGCPGWPAAVAGPTRNADLGDPFAAASQAITNHLTDTSLDEATGRLGFAPTSSVACRAEVHRALPFDDGYPLAAGEDRDWCARLAARGEALVYEPAAWVDHHQDLGWRGFWRQQVRYGRGAYRFHRTAAPDARFRTPGFYVGLVRAGFAQGPTAGLLVLVAQVATAAGLLREAAAASRPPTNWRR
jgi:glycosyltransferase involved in cell wall biosynthesis